MKWGDVVSHPAGAVSAMTAHVDDPLKDFVSADSLGAEFERAIGMAKASFSPATSIRATLEHDPEEEGAPPAIVFRVATALQRVAFRDARMGFYRALRESGCRRLWNILVVVRD